jgi:hypothetical protein
MSMGMPAIVAMTAVKPMTSPVPPAPAPILAMAVELTKWWMERQETISAREMDDRFTNSSGVELGRIVADFPVR